ncbi:MAG: hypothetical protein NTY38_22500, partial [Acidobacteria bacterium]|nr:hypothetical protein [Acidobacteriota bacterium]
FGQGSFSQLPHQEYEELFQRNLRAFEDKWAAKWVPHRTRPNVRPAFGERKIPPSEFCSPRARKV